MKKTSYFLCALLLSSFAFAETPATENTSYLCTATYLYRKVVTLNTHESGRVRDLETFHVSTISTDFGNSTAGGGGSVLGSHMKKEIFRGTPSVLSYTQYLKDRDGNELEPIGGFNNGGKYNFDVKFFDIKKNKQVGPEFVIKNEQTQIAEVRKNEFIQVSCNFVRKLKYKN